MRLTYRRKRKEIQLMYSARSGKGLREESAPVDGQGKREVEKG